MVPSLTFILFENVILRPSFELISDVEADDFNDFDFPIPEP